MDSEKWKSFNIENKKNLPSKEEIHDEVLRKFPNDFSISSEMSEEGSGFRIEIFAEKPYDTCGNKEFLNCIIICAPDYAPNEFSIRMKFVIADKEFEGDYQLPKLNNYLILSIIILSIAALFTGGISLILAVILYLVFKYLDNKVEKRKAEEEAKLARYSENIFQFIKEWVERINTHQKKDAYNSYRSTDLKDKLSAMKEKISSKNSDNGFRIAEDGTIIRN